MTKYSNINFYCSCKWINLLVISYLSCFILHKMLIIECQYSEQIYPINDNPVNSFSPVLKGLLN